MNKKILKMIGKRIVQSIIVVFIVTLLVFLLMQLVPGDPIVNFLGSNATEEQVAYYTEDVYKRQPIYWKPEFTMYASETVREIRISQVQSIWMQRRSWSRSGISAVRADLRI